MIPFMVRLRRRLSRELDALAPSTIFGNSVVLLQSEALWHQAAVDRPSA
jgi:hypothetical protein